jgi:putative membrane protein
MKVLQIKVTKQLTNLIKTVGLSVAIAVVGYSQINSPAIAKIISQNPAETTKQQTQISQLERVYLTEAAQTGMAELAMAKLALEKSQNDKVKQYAQQMIKDHTPINQELQQLATQKGITLPTEMGMKYQALITQLSKLSGADFDQAYINEAGINTHMEGLILNSRLLQLGEDKELKAFAGKNIPLIESHLQLLEKLFAVQNQQ